MSYTGTSEKGLETLQVLIILPIPNGEFIQEGFGDLNLLLRKWRLFYTLSTQGFSHTS